MEFNRAWVDAKGGGCEHRESRVVSVIRLTLARGGVLDPTIVGSCRRHFLHRCHRGWQWQGHEQHDSTRSLHSRVRGAFGLKPIDCIHARVRSLERVRERPSLSIGSTPSILIFVYPTQLVAELGDIQTVARTLPSVAFSGYLPPAKSLSGSG